MVITLSCCIQTKVVMMQNFLPEQPQRVSPRARCPAAPTINQNEWLRANCPFQITDICGKGEKIIFENWIIIKPMGHSAQAAHRRGWSSRSKIYCRRLEQVLCKCCKTLKGPTLDILFLFLFFSWECTVKQPLMIYWSPQECKCSTLYLHSAVGSNLYASLDLLEQCSKWNEKKVKFSRHKEKHWLSEFYRCEYWYWYIDR